MHLRKYRSLELLSNFQKKKKNWLYYNPPEEFSPVQYCLDSSIHGLQYIGQQNRHCFERLFWLVAFITSIICASLLISQLWTSYTDSPIVSEFYPVDLPVNEIAFPSITICNINQIRLSKITEYLKAYYGVDSSPHAKREALRSLKKLHYLCDDDYMWDLIGDLYPEKVSNNENLTGNYHRDMDSVKDFSYTNLLKDLENVGQSCEEMIDYCMLDNQVNCEKLFRPIMTDYGMCCTFNMMPLTFLMRGYKENEPLEFIESWNMTDITSDNLIRPPVLGYNAKDPIFRQQYQKSDAALFVKMKPDLAETYCPAPYAKGFFVGLHSPLAFPFMQDDVLKIQAVTDTLVKITPQITIGDKGIKKFHPKTRKCYFDDERILSHYTIYTENNCLSECFSQKSLAKCNCVPLFNLSKPPDVDYCFQYQLMYCIENDDSLDCSRCYRSCTDIQYEADVNTIPTSTTIRSNVTRLGFRFGQKIYQARLRREKYTVIDLISSAGGLLGLCMGFSMLSILEILYYCTIRLGCIYRRKSSSSSTQKRSSDMNVGLASSYSKMGQNWMTKLWSKRSRNKKDEKDTVFMIHRRPVNSVCSEI